MKSAIQENLYTISHHLSISVAIASSVLFRHFLVRNHFVPSNSPDQEGLLGRPLRVGIVEWPGYAGGIVANNGFRPNKDCIFWSKDKLLVEFDLVEDADARAKAFASGGLDIVWSTVDFWANELPGFVQGGVQARAVIQVDWSRGGDALVVDKGINRLDDLVGKRISLALFTPSEWLLVYSLQHSMLTSSAQSEVISRLVATNSSSDARADFVANKVDAAVVWEPDVTEALKQRAGAHILVSTRMFPDIIADVMVARLSFISEHPAVIAAFVRGWLQGTEQANRDADSVARLLMQNEPLYRGLGPGPTRNSLGTVKWAGLADNVRMFGLDGQQPLFDQIFTEAGEAWVKLGYISRVISPRDARDAEFLRKIYASSKNSAQFPQN